MQGRPMPNLLSPAGQWTTSAFGNHTDTLPGELKALGQHVNSCNQRHDRMFRARSFADALHAFTVPRLMTTLVMATVLLVCSAFIW
jgi:hypothetical protein